MATPDRPLSPHLQVYKPQFTTVLSILHRITGVVLAFGTFGLAGWLLMVSENDYDGKVRFLDYDGFLRLAVSIPGRIALVGFSYCLIYHFLNGLRHLFWDMGRGLAIKQAQRTGWAVVILSIALTAGLWLTAMTQGGGP